MRQICTNNKCALAQGRRTNSRSSRDSCFANTAFSKVEYNTHRNPYSLMSFHVCYTIGVFYVHLFQLIVPPTHRARRDASALQCHPEHIRFAQCKLREGSRCPSCEILRGVYTERSE